MVCMWGIHKFFFRVDFPVRFSLADHLGRLADFLFDYLEGRNKKGTCEIRREPAILVARFQLEPGPHFVHIEIGFSHLIAIEEYPEPRKDTQLASSFSIILLDELREQIQLQGLILRKFRRIGLRALQIADSGGETFIELKDKLFPQAPFQSHGFSLSPKDIGFILEFNKDNQDARVMFGPYQKAEKAKYFEKITPAVEFGLICDCDFRLHNLEIPGKKFYEIVQERASNFSEIAGRITIGEVANDS